MTIQIAGAILLFVCTYIVVALDLTNKASVALFGATLAVLFHLIPLETAYTKIDYDVIVLLMAMMVIVNVIRETGLFEYAAIKAAKAAKGDPVRILISLMLVTAVFSAILDNVTTVLILSPLSILIAVELGISPIPFLIVQAIGSNIGGTATLIGDPPNIMIASGGKLSFNDFLINMAPLIVVITAVSVVVTYLLFRKSLVVPQDRRARIMAFDENRAITDRPFLYKSLAALGIVIAGFFLHDTLNISPAVSALFGASILLLLAGEKTDDYFAGIEWTTIFFFAGLFVLVGTLEELGVIGHIGKALMMLAGDNITMASMIILWGSGILSGIIDNIPFVATMIPVIQVFMMQLGMGHNCVLWWSLSAGACLGGNITLVGATANVIVAGIAKKNGYHISFMQFFRYGVLYTAISLTISSAYIILRYL